MPKTKRRRKIPPTTPEMGKQLADKLDEVILSYSGPVDELEQALGFYLIGRHVGWRVLVVMHNKRTIRKYQEILGGIDIREIFDPVGPDAERSLGYRVASELSNFWKAVSGDARIEGRRQIE